MDWISVKDKFPEERRDVLCIFQDKERHRRRIEISWVDSARCFLFEDIYGQVTHWMPLPEPPKDENE